MNFYQALKDHFGVDSERKALYRKVDWVAMALTFLVAFAGYLFTLAPDLTLEDCGELAVGSYYAGIPHPPGYPVWTLYSWLFTVLVPVSNIAYRVAISSAFASALSCGIIALLISRGASLILEAWDELKGLDKKLEGWICSISGFVGGLLFGYNGFVWSQSVIVEVYTLSVLSLVVVLAFMMRWMYAPSQRHYLYLAMFMFGICFTNHQTLLVAAMGLEVMILLVSPTLGREMLMGNSLIFLYMLWGAIAKKYENLNPDKPIFKIFVAVGVLSIIGYIFLAIKNKYDFSNKNFIRQWCHNLCACVVSGFCWVMGCLFYFFMPISSMTNPPMNWGYPRSVNGFFHALTRGQYESANPTSDILNFFDQLRVYIYGAMEEFTLVILLLALIPFVLLFFLKMGPHHKKRIMWISIGYAGLFLLGLLIFWSNQTHILSQLQSQAKLSHVPLETLLADAQAAGIYFSGADLWLKLQGAFSGFIFSWILLLLVATPFIFFKDLSGKMDKTWLAGSTSVFFCLAIILLILLNPQADKQSQDLHKVFFTSSYVFFSLWIGYGVATILAFLATQYQRYREVAALGGALASGMALYALASTISDSSNPLYIATAVLGLLMALAIVVLLVCNKTISPTRPLLVILLLVPVYTVMAHWWENEQRGHLFGFWYGHDMFTPPFEDQSGKPLYPEMPKDSILFGGTDPGRFCPTYMIFCESQIPSEKKRDPKFDRRDVYIITQNALADPPYLDYIRAHYSRSTQHDTNFFGQLFPSKYVRWMMNGLDSYFTAYGKKVEDRRRAEGIYPKEEIYIPSYYDFSVALNEFIEDSERRYRKGELKPGENYDPATRTIQGQAGVMLLNASLTKLIFDKNPDKEFYIEESFALDWMYPYLSPYGIIMKINRDPITTFTPEMVARDHEFWCRYMDRLCGDWITSDTSIHEICDFARKVYLQGDFKGYKGDMKFLRDNDAQKSFSKLRSALTGLYWWRINSATTLDEQQLLIKEAEFAGKQAYAICPFSPEALYKLVNVLAVQSRFDDAIELILTTLEFDPENKGLEDLLKRVAGMKHGYTLEQESAHLQELEKLYQADTNSVSNTVSLATAYLEAKRSNEAQALLLQILPKLKKANDENPLDTETAIYLFSVYNMVKQADAAQAVITKLLTSEDLSLAGVIACAQATLQLGNTEQTEEILKRAVKLAPGNAEILYDLSAMQAIMGKQDESLGNLNLAVDINHAQRQTNSNIRDLVTFLPSDKRFDSVRDNPAFPKK